MRHVSFGFLSHLCSQIEKGMLEIGKYNKLKILKKVDFGLYLDGGDLNVLLPNRHAPKEYEIGDELEVFLYHDSDERIIATTEKPLGLVGDLVKMKVFSVTPIGAFLEWGLSKQLFLPHAEQVTECKVGGYVLVKIFIDEKSGRIAATEKVEKELSNDSLSVKEMESVHLRVIRRSDLGFVVAINDKHVGLMHDNTVFKSYSAGDTLQGYILTIREDHKIDVMPGVPGHKKILSEAEKILQFLEEHGGFLPFHDKSNPEEIYLFFGMSKKTFKMTLGTLYKDKKILLEPAGIRIAEK